MNLDEHHHVFILTSATDVVFSIFHVPCTILFTVQFHTVSSVSSVFRTSIYAVFVIDCFRKQTLLIKWYNFVFTKDLPPISQTYKLQRLKRKSIIPCVTWCPLNYKIIAFFLWGISWRSQNVYKATEQYL